MWLWPGFISLEAIQLEVRWLEGLAPELEHYFSGNELRSCLIVQVGDGGSSHIYGELTAAKYSEKIESLKPIALLVHRKLHLSESIGLILHSRYFIVSSTILSKAPLP